MPGKQEGAQDGDHPDAPKMVLAGIALHGLSARSPDPIIGSAATQVGFTGVGKIASRFQKQFLALPDLKESGFGRSLQETGLREGRFLRVVTQGPAICSMAGKAQGSCISTVAGGNSEGSPWEA